MYNVCIDVWVVVVCVVFVCVCVIPVHVRLHPYIAHALVLN